MADQSQSPEDTPTERLPGGAMPNPAPSAGLDGHATGDLGFSVKPSVPPQDLSEDKLLATAPRAPVGEENDPAPALGGIPLLAKLGQGGMGAVYYAIHPRLDVEVAVKVLPFLLAEQRPEFVQRFLREAKVAASIKSPNLVGVNDVNQESGLYYIVMEYVGGESAGSCLRRQAGAGTPGLREPLALDLCIAATQGLVVAHEKGVIHRDIKPDNILIPRAEGGDELEFTKAKLADLGLARAENAGKSLTDSMATMGTPGYMAPEQGMDAKNAGKPADVFSMGATLYALLIGEAPFAGSAVMKILMDTAYAQHIPVRERRREVSDHTAKLIDRTLAKDPSERFANASALLEALKASRWAPGQSIVSGQESTAQTVRPASPPRPLPSVPTLPPTSAPVTPSASSPSGTAEPQPQKSRVAGFVTALVTMTLLMGGGLWLLMGNRGAENRSPAMETNTKKEAARKEAKTVIDEDLVSIRKAVAAIDEVDRSDAKDIARALARLEALRTQYSARPVGDLEGLDGARAELLERSALLTARRRKFEGFLADAQGLLGSDPMSALAKLKAAETLGRADPDAELPDLVAALDPDLASRRKTAQDAVEAMEKAKREAADIRTKALECLASVEALRSTYNKAEADLKSSHRHEPDNAVLKRLDELCARHSFEATTRQAAEKALNFGKNLLTDGQCANAIKKFENAESRYKSALAFRRDAEQVVEALEGCRSSMLVVLKTCTKQEGGLYAPVKRALADADEKLNEGAASPASRLAAEAAKTLPMAGSALKARRLADRARKQVESLSQMRGVAAIFKTGQESFARGDTLGRDGQYEKAQSAYAAAREGFTRALETAKNQTDALLDLARRQHREKTYLAALKTLNVLLQYAPQSTEALRLKQVVEHDHEYVVALEDVRQLLNSKPNDAVHRKTDSNDDRRRHLDTAMKRVLSLKPQGKAVEGLIRRLPFRHAVIDVQKVFKEFKKVERIQQYLESRFEPRKKALEIRGQKAKKAEGKGRLPPKELSDLKRDFEQLAKEVESARLVYMKEVLRDIVEATRKTAVPVHLDLVLRTQDREASPYPGALNASKSFESATTAAEAVRVFRENAALFVRDPILTERQVAGKSLLKLQKEGEDITKQVIDVLNREHLREIDR